MKLTLNDKFSEEEFYKFVIRQKMIVHEDGILFVYRQSEGSWIRVEDSDKIKMVLNKFIPSNKRAGIKPVAIDNAVRKLKCDPDIYIYINLSKRAEANKEFLNVLNGLIDLKTGKLMKHDPNRYFTYCLKFNYEPHHDITESDAFT